MTATLSLECGCLCEWKRGELARVISARPGCGMHDARAAASLQPTTHFLERLVSVLGFVTYKSWRLVVLTDPERADAPYLQWQFDSVCAKSGDQIEGRSRKWYLSAHQTESELVQTAFKAALTAEEHECREFFRYRGKRVLNPHISVQALLDVCDQEDVRA